MKRVIAIAARARPLAPSIAVSVRSCRLRVTTRPAGDSIVPITVLTTVSASPTAAFRARLGAWPVSSAALAIGTAAYRDQAWIAATRKRLMADKAALDTVLQRHGFSPRGESPLFRLIETEDAQALFDRLARHAILTRPFDYDPRWLRLGLPGSPEGLERLDRALANG